MKFLKKDTIATFLLALFFSVAFSAVLAAGGQGAGTVQAGGGTTESHKMKQPEQRNQHEHQKGVGGTGKGGQSVAGE